MRDADRILAAAKDARLTQIDHLITTHYHGDHYGAMSEVASRIPIKDFIDHGPNVQPATAADEFLQKVYPQLYAKSKHTIAKPGDKIELERPGRARRRVGGSDRSRARSLRRQPQPVLRRLQAEGSRSAAERAVGRHDVTFGRFKTVHLGDLTWNKESDLMCPTNRLGAVDLFIVSHHGQAISNSEVLVHAVAPRVMIMNNGTRKGGQPDAMKVMHASPGLEDLWQIHFSLSERPGVPPCPECSSPTGWTSSRWRCPLPRRPRPRQDRERRRRRRTTGRPIGSRSRLARMVRSLSPTRAMDSRSVRARTVIRSMNCRRVQVNRTRAVRRSSRRQILRAGVYTSQSYTRSH